MTEADEQIHAAIREGNSFYVDAGAGSGKTSSLVEALTLLRSEFKQALISNRQQVACITYTNVAKDEILERTEYDGLFVVSTIHEFLWRLIRAYQSELRLAVIRFNGELPANSRRKINPDDLAAALSDDVTVTYSEFGSNFLEGRLHHDDLIGVAGVMFEDNPLLSRLTGSAFPYVFVDEYQDTASTVITILLDRILSQSPTTVVGFFGDKLQAIYGGVVGELDDAHKALLIPIQKRENYRCSTAVIDLLNRLRTDIKQVPAGTNAEGAAIYAAIEAESGATVKDRYVALSEHLVDPPAFEEAKVLYLTHKLIAREAGYEDLFEAYRVRGGFAKEQFQQGNEAVAQFLAFNIDFLANEWASGEHASALSLLQKGGFKLQSMAHKTETNAALDGLVDLVASGQTIGELVTHVKAANLLRLPDKLVDGIELSKLPSDEVSEEDQRLWTFYKSLLSVSATQLHQYRAVLEKNMPYSTKHGVKGDEFETVVVVLDDAGARWNQYAFGKRLEGADTSEARWNRTSNLFYVCCSRARVNLVVIDLGYSPARRAGVEALFGAENVFA